TSTGGGRGSCVHLLPRVDERRHPMHGLADSDLESAGDDREPDVQLLDVRERGDGGDVLVVEPVSRVDAQAVLAREHGRGPEARELVPALRSARVRIAARVELDELRADVDGGGDLPEVGVDEEADLRAALPERGDGAQETAPLGE